MTEKGKGYEPAEKAPDKFHGISPFNVATGETVSKSKKDSYSKVFGKVLCDEAKHNDKVTAAMADGTGLTGFQNMFPERFFDVGIAEEHAVTFAAGLAAGGMKPVVAIYSSFLQRAYDQMVHDVGMQNLPVVFAVDRAGLVGSDGETHQGVFDLSYLSIIPNLTVLAPKHKWELADMLRFAISHDGPAAVRYPRGSAYDEYEEFRSPVIYGKSEMIYEESEIAVISIGHMFEEAVKVRLALKQKGCSCTLVNGRFVKPVDIEMLQKLSRNHKLIVTIEENVKTGGYGMQVVSYVQEQNLPVDVLPMSLPDQYIEQGNVELLRKEAGIDWETMTEKIIRSYKVK